MRARFLLSCPADTSIMVEVLEVLAASGIAPERILCEGDPKLGVFDIDLEVDTGSPTELASVLQEIPGVKRLYLIIDDRVVPLR